MMASVWVGTPAGDWSAWGWGACNKLPCLRASDMFGQLRQHSCRQGLSQVTGVPEFRCTLFCLQASDKHGLLSPSNITVSHNQSVRAV